MTTLTDKEMIKEIKERIGSLDVRDNIERRAYEIALASLEAEPVASCIIEDGSMCVDGFGEYVGHSLPDGTHQLYTVPPASVVPDEVRSAIWKVVRIYADFIAFDGDKRSFVDSLDEAEDALILAVHRHAGEIAAAEIKD
jgi:hypothetical protein